MNVDGQPYRTIWIHPQRPAVVQIIDQRDLPHRFVIEDLQTLPAVCDAIRDMHVRGAGLIGAAAGYGMYVSGATAPAGLSDLRSHLAEAGEQLRATRPTAVNLAWAVQRQLDAVQSVGEQRADQLAALRATADAIADEDAEFCRRLGEHGVALIEELHRRKGGEPVVTAQGAGGTEIAQHGDLAPFHAAARSAMIGGEPRKTALFRGEGGWDLSPEGAGQNKVCKSGRRGARLARREEGEYWWIFNRRATQPAGMDRRPDCRVCFDPLPERVRPVNILTHCNAGWLAFVDHGSATAPIYAAHDRGLAVHVWVDETRPRNQGARLTAWELGQHGVPHTVIPDNVGGHLMQKGLVDLVITGTDRTTYTGDVANKIGTYLKALAARDNDVPFYVALPSSTFDWEIADGVRDIPIEQRGDDEVSYARGWLEGRIQQVRLAPAESPAANYAFDVTPARLVTGLITERGICEASAEGVLGLFPERRR